ncbi:MAG: ORF6N domain-containing protein [Candidatus Marinimicrobia bacterium]|nr:ORF6N domain-containing protein [Candidatus Neomarinimicrobiota bacterium]
MRLNKDRFPEEFCFQLTDMEFDKWKSQIVMSNADLCLSATRNPEP